MIKEDYGSFEVAKLLKEKGFDGWCFGYYKPNNEFGTYVMPRTYSGVDGNYILAPTLQMALKWLREIHKIHITVYPYGEYSCDNYQFDIYKNRKYLLSKDEGYITNEQAIEVAIKYCLENLI